MTEANSFRCFDCSAKTDRAELAKLINRLVAGDVLVVTRLDRLARSTRDLLNVLATVAERKAGFRSLKDTWADTTTAHGRLMLTVLGGLAEFERVDKGQNRRRQGPCQGPWSEVWTTCGSDDASTAGSAPGMPFAIHPHMVRHACGFTPS